MNPVGHRRILLIAQKPQRRGAEVFARDLSIALRKRGHRAGVAYLYPFAGPGPLPLQEEDVVLGGDEAHPFERLPGLHPGLLQRLRRHLRTFSPDVVVVVGGRAVKYGAVARRLDRDRDWRLVYRNIGEPRRWVRGRLKRWVYRRLLMPQIDAVVAVSAATLAALESFYRLSVPSLTIPRAVDPEALAPRQSRSEVRDELATPQDTPVLIYVGSLTAEKRPDRLLRIAAAAACERPDLVLWVVGEGPLRNDSKARTADSPLAGRVRFLGARDDVGDLLAAADLLLLTSDTEGVPGVVLEAGALGVPAVATRVGGVPECIEPGRTGLLFAPTDEDAGAAAVLALVTDPDRRRAQGAAAAALVRERFHIDAAVRRYEELFARLLDRGADGDGS